MFEICRTAIIAKSILPAWIEIMTIVKKKVNIAISLCLNTYFNTVIHVPKAKSAPTVPERKV